MATAGTVICLTDHLRTSGERSLRTTEELHPEMDGGVSPFDAVGIDYGESRAGSLLRAPSGENLLRAVGRVLTHKSFLLVLFQVIICFFNFLFVS